MSAAKKKKSGKKVSTRAKAGEKDLGTMAAVPLLARV